MSKPNEPSFVDTVLHDFVAQNPHCSIQIENSSSLYVEKPWGRNDARLKLACDDHEFINDLNNLIFSPKFDGVMHIDTKQIEFIYAYLLPDSEDSKLYINRKFNFFFGGNEYECEFAKPTDRLMRVASHFERLPTEPDEPSVPQLTAFRDAQRIAQLQPRQQRFFEGRIPRNFFVTAKNGFSSVNTEQLVRHLNFLITYYDRGSPVVNIKEAPTTNSDSIKPIRMIEDTFPPSLVISQPIDDIVIRLLEVARKSSPRFAFIYYYQVFEYAGFYYIDEKARSSLRSALRDPSLICGGEDKVSEIFSIFSDLTHSDDVRMRKVIEEHCDPRVIWKEVFNDHDFFSSEQQFEGGYIANPLIGTSVTEEAWSTMWMPKTFDLLTKIRNVLVHAREKRESKVILPSPKNNITLSRYIPLMQRMAEQLAIKG